jgi:hypothetical protein
MLCLTFDATKIKRTMEKQENVANNLCGLRPYKLAFHSIPVTAPGQAVQVNQCPL